MPKRSKDRPATILRVVRGGYEPASAYDEEFHSRFHLGAEVTAEIVQPVNQELMRKYWWTLDLVVPNLEDYHDKRSLSNALLLEAGCFDSVTLLMGGGVNMHPRSISEMDQPEFEDFFTKAMLIIEDVFGIDVEALQAEARAATTTNGKRR